MNPNGLVLAAALAILPAPAFAFDVNGAAPGGSESDVKKGFPSARCKPLEWQSLAADRRCDDGRIAFAGVGARITVFLKSGVIEALDLRFETRDLERVAGYLKSRYGKPLAERRETIEREGKAARQIYKARWERDDQMVVLTSQLDKRRSTLTVWRGNFEEEIYRVR